MAVLIWITEGTWTSCIDAARQLVPGSTDIGLLHVTGDEVAAAARGAFSGLLGRGHPERDPGARIEALAQGAAEELLDAATRRLGRPATWLERHGRTEREVVQACEGAELLIVARDGDRSRLVRTVSAQPRDSWWTMHRARCCWYGRNRVRGSTRCRHHRPTRPATIRASHRPQRCNRQLRTSHSAYHRHRGGRADRAAASGGITGLSPRKVRAPQGRVVVNGNPGRPAGQCHRKQTAGACGRR